MAVYGIKGETNRIRLEEHIPLATPMRVLMEVSSYCNFHCSFCPHGNGEAMKLMPQAIMDTSLAEKCIHELKGFDEKVRVLAFACYGEPLINRYIGRIIKSAHDHDVAEKYEITTNASLLTKELAEELIGSGISIINISIYGLSELEYKSFSGVTIAFDELVGNIAFLYAIRANAQVVIKISDATCKKDEQREQFNRIFSSICDKICIEHAVPLWYEFGDNESELDIYGKQVVRKEVCPIPFFTLAINANGIVSPCCNDWKQKLRMGDANKDSIVSIWNGARYRELHKSLLSEGTKSLSPCRDCRYHELVAMDNIDLHREMLLRKYED